MNVVCDSFIIQHPTKDASYAKSPQSHSLSSPNAAYMEEKICLPLPLSSPNAAYIEEEILCHACLHSPVKPSDTHTNTAIHKRYLQYNYFHDRSGTSPSFTIIKLSGRVAVCT